MVQAQLFVFSFSYIVVVFFFVFGDGHEVWLKDFDCGEHRGTLRGHGFFQGRFGSPADRFGHQSRHQLAGMDVLFGEAVHFVEIEFQRAHNIAIVIDRHCEQRLDFPLAAQVRVEHKLGADILGAQHLPGTDAGSANRRFQRNLAA